MKFLSHLELMRIFFRATRRANLPVVFSRGFTPRPRFAFGPPLQLGVESLCEFVDVPFYERGNIATWISLLDRELPEGVSVTAGEEIDEKRPSIQISVDQQRYELAPLGDSDSPLAVPSDWEERSITRTRKGKAKHHPLKTFVSTVSSDKQKLSFELRTLPSGASLKPYEVVSALTDQDPLAFRILKTEVAFRE